MHQSAHDEFQPIEKIDIDEIELTALAAALPVRTGVLAGRRDITPCI